MRLERWATHERAPWFLFAALAVVYAATMSRGYVSIDAQASDILAQHLAQAGNPWVEHVPFLHPDARNPFLVQNGSHLTIGRTPGQILLAVPAFWLFARHSDVLHTWPGSLTAAVMAAGAMAFFFAAMRRLLPWRLAVLAALTAALTTPVWSVAADALWAHPLTALGICLAIWGSALGRGSVSGIGYGLGILARPHVAVIAGIHGIWEAVARRSVRPLLGIGVPSAAGLGLSLAWNHFVIGGGAGVYGKTSARVTPGEVPREAGNPYWHDLLGFLISPNRGLFFWTPMLVLLLALAIRHHREVPSWTKGLALGGVGYVLVQLDLNGFSGGNAFYGYRLAIEPLLCLLPFCFLGLQAARPSRRVRQLLAVLIAWQLATVAIGSFDSGSHYDGVRIGVLSEQNRWLVNGAWHTATTFWWLGILMPPLFALGYWTVHKLFVSEHSLS